MRRPSDDNLRRWGRSLREIDPGSMQADEEGPVRWYLGDGGTELFAWGPREEAPHHVQLVFARVSVEWVRDRGLTTGSFSGTAATAGGRYDAYLLSVARAVDPEVCAAALLLLEATSVPSAVVDALTAALRQALASLDTPTPSESGAP